ALSAGGAEASQKGLGDVMPRNLVVRSAISRTSPQESVDGQGSDLAVLHGGHGQIAAAVDAVAASPYTRQRSPSFRVDRDSILAQLDDLRCLGVTLPQHLLSDRLED